MPLGDGMPGLLPRPNRQARRLVSREPALELTYVGPLLVAVGYGVQLNLSNSFGQSLIRHIVTLKLAYRLPWSIYATLKAQLWSSRYLDPVLLDRARRDADRSSPSKTRTATTSSSISSVRSARRGLAVNARYSVFTNELTPSPVSFLRQVVYLGLTYRVGAR